MRAFGERGLAKLAAAPGGRWVVVSQNKLFPEYATLTSAGARCVPPGRRAAGRCPTRRDVVYAGWYDPPPGTSRAVTLPPVPPEGDADEE